MNYIFKIKCNNCNKRIERYLCKMKKHKYHFCSRKCQGKWNSKHRIGKNSPGYKEKIKVSCANCSKILFRIDSRAKRNNRHFCNYSCHGEWITNHKSGKHSHAYINGNSKKYYTTKFLNIRESIRKRDKYKCQACKLTQKFHIKKYEKKLSVHHVAYDKLDFNPRYLISLCCKCHIKTNYNRDYWFAYFDYSLNKY